MRQIEMLANFSTVSQHAIMCACSLAGPRCLPLLTRAISKWQKSLLKMAQISTTKTRCVRYEVETHTAAFARLIACCLFRVSTSNVRCVFYGWVIDICKLSPYLSICESVWVERKGPIVCRCLGGPWRNGKGVDERWRRYQYQN